jgi:ketosteroid isomerase-like protein
MNQPESEVHRTIAAINQAWRTGHVSDMAQHLHPDIVVKFPKFSGQLVGREKLLAGFEEFCTNARVIEYSESDEQIEVIGNCAVVSFQFDMLYERPAYRERSRGRDLWVMQRESDRWLAVWRTLTELTESREQEGSRGD